MKIGEVAKVSGVNASTLRYYERLNLIPAPNRQGAQRDYDDEVFSYLKIIDLAKKTGFTLREIRLLLSDTDSHMDALKGWRSLAEGKLSEIKGMIRQYQMMEQLLNRGLACNCIRLDECEVLGL